jgi:HAD superfamily hydrolase (TIGR01509 family)
MLKALIFDVDGTLADTEDAHLRAFNRAFDELSLGWHWTQQDYSSLLEISGGKERIKQFWLQENPKVKGLDAQAVTEHIARIHELKTAYYEHAVNQGEVQLREGVLALIQEAVNSRLHVAIATTTSPVNIATLMRHAIGPDWRTHFAAVEDASTAPVKKPHPQVYLHLLQKMGLDAQDCLAFEDSRNGLQSAQSAGLATIITPTHYTHHHDFDGALKVLPSLRGVNVATLNGWHSDRAS